MREQLSPEAQKQWDAALALYKTGQWDGARTGGSGDATLRDAGRRSATVAVAIAWKRGKYTHSRSSTPRPKPPRRPRWFPPEGFRVRREAP